MIRYALRCDQGHDFDSWFQSAEAYDGLKTRKLVECPDCGTAKVEKSLMAPKVQGTKKSKIGIAVSAPTGASKTINTSRETALAQLRKHVEDNSEYVGMNFAAEARAIHTGDSPERSIYGEARITEAKALIEDGVPVAPLPFAPKHKMN